MSTPSQPRRVLGVLPASAIVASSMIGTGIFTTTGFMAGAGAGRGDILLAWFVGGIIALCGALCYGEIGAHYPASGGECHYLSRLLHPSLGFISGWISLVVGFAAPIAAAAMAMSLYLASVIPGWPARAGAAAGIVLLSGLHTLELRVGARVQMLLIAVKVVFMVAFSVFALGRSAPESAGLAVQPEFWGSSAFAVVLVLVSFSYSGWNAAAYVGAEVVAPERTLPRSLLLGTAGVTALYLLINLAYVSAVPLESLANVEEVAYVVARDTWGEGAARIVSMMIALTLIAPMSAMLMTGPRVAEAMARDGFLPDWLGRLNRRGVPRVGVWFQATIAVAIVLTASFSALLIYIGFTLNIFTGLAVVGLIRLRRRGQSRYRLCVGYPVPAVVFLAFAAWVTIWSIQSEPWSAMAGLATVGVGYATYLFSRNTHAID